MDRPSFIIRPTMHRWCVVCAVVVVIVAKVHLSSATAVVEEHQVTAGRDTPLAWPPCLKEGRRRRSAESSSDGFEYAVVVDAGSSGTRVRVYQWPTPVGGARVALQVPGVDEIYSLKITPGLSTHAADLQRISDDIHGILSDAAEHVPRPLQRTTPVYVMATAGMRLLLEDRMNLVMHHIDSMMRNSSFQPFHFASVHSARILSGEEEGVFAWIAVNYLLGVFSNDIYSHSELVGILEMGGASTQIAFAPEGDILAAKFPVLIGGHRYPLYVRSYLPYGQNSVDKTVKELLATDSDPSQHVVHPCMLRGDVVSDDRLNRTFNGSGDPDGCLRILNQLVHKADASDCNPKPCGIGVFYQPTIDSNISFYAVGAFGYALQDIGAVTPDGIYVPRTGFEKATEFCTKHINEFLKPTTTPEKRQHISRRCLVSLYTATLFTRGYGFANDTQQIHVTNKIDNEPIEWSLGAVLYEDELAATQECVGTPQSAEVRTNGASSLTAGVSTALRYITSLF